MPDIPHPSKDIKESLGTELRGKRIVLCITGSVAAVHCPEIARKLMRHGAEVFTVFSEAAQTIIHPYLMEWATGNPVVTKLTGKIEHVALAGNHSFKADLVLIAPATANTISKIAMGVDDTPVTSTVTTAFGSEIQIMVVPAMHASMYNHPILKENIEKLEKLGVTFIGPHIEEGKAKLASPSEVVHSVIQLLGSKHDLAKVKILVTAGPTIEYIDPVRILTNRSSGRMGAEIARMAWNRGAEVTLVYGRGSVSPPSEVKVVRVETSKEMYDTVVSELESTEYEVVIAAAAVADWTPTTQKREKIATRKTTKLSIQLRPTKKIVDKVKEIRQEAFLVLFKAEHGVSNDELIERAYKRLQTANADLIVANDVGRPGVGFETLTNELFIIDKEKTVVHVPRTSKQDAAKRLLDIIVSNLS